MKKILMAGILAAAVTASAGPAAMFGVAYNIQGGDFGFTVKVISNNKKNRIIGAAGMSYYPWAPVKKFGLDLSGGYLFDGAAVTAGWDFLKSDYQGAVGYVNVVDEGTSVVTAAAASGGDAAAPTGL